MAANLAGLFSQLNNAIQANPTADVFGNLLGNVSQGAGNIGAGMLGMDNPYKFMNEQAKAQQVQDQVGLLDLNTAEGLAKAGAEYGMAGQIENQMKLQQAAQEKQKEQMVRESLIGRASKVGLTGVAESLKAGGSIQEAQKMVSDMEKSDLISLRGAGARRGLAKTAGITDEEFEELNLAEIDAETFKQVIEGQQGDTKAYVDANGKPIMLRTSKYGRVWDKAQNKFVNPSELSLTPAPNVQKVHNLSTDLVKGLGDKAVENFSGLYENANNAVDQLANVDRALTYLKDMPTGAGANLNVFARRLAMAWGGDPDMAVANAEQYVSESGKRVAEIIKAFGSGTGLSDADREYAQKIAAGDITVTATALKKLLEIQRKGALGTIDHYNKTDTALRNRLGDESAVLDMFILKDTPEAPKGTLIYNPSTGTFE